MPKLTINDALTTYGKQIRKYTMRMSEVRHEKESLAKVMEEEPEDQTDIGETEAPEGAPEIVEADAVASDAGGTGSE